MVFGSRASARAAALFALEHFGSIVEFSLAGEGRGGADPLLFGTQVNESMRVEVVAGWVSALMVMKVAVDRGIDLCTDDASRSWTDGHADH